jgi:hypothetical protein
MQIDKCASEFYVAEIGRHREYMLADVVVTRRAILQCSNGPAMPKIMDSRSRARSTGIRLQSYLPHQSPKGFLHGRIAKATTAHRDEDVVVPSAELPAALQIALQPCLRARMKR